MKLVRSTQPVDFCKGHDDLAAVVQEALRRDPFCGALFVFRSKRLNRVKIPERDGGGPWNICPCCNGARHVIGEDVSRRLDVVPVQYRILVTRRPRYGCWTRESGVVQAPEPDHVVAGFPPTEALVAQVPVGTYAD